MQILMRGDCRQDDQVPLLVNTAIPIPASADADIWQQGQARAH